MKTERRDTLLVVSGRLVKSSDLKVKVTNKKSDHFGRTGKVKRMDRGNVWVTLEEPTEEICTRWSCLEPVEPK